MHICSLTLIKVPWLLRVSLAFRIQGRDMICLSKGPTKGSTERADPGKGLGFHGNPRQETFQMSYEFWKHCYVKESII